MVARKATLNMAIPYNLSGIDAANTTMKWFSAVNQLSGGLQGNIFSVLFFVIILVLITSFTADYRKGLVGAGVLSFVGSLFTLGYQLTGVWVCVLYAVAFIAGIILLQNQDYG